ncbi:hypothetical protein WJX72_006363 [[Myrmecia] bisecta]|uniref:Uncharacterized protein n=1 Tax=[Myrmecia] bisecta TaxID=41462 RepID=A0AAW1PGH8_9CHLO
MEEPSSSGAAQESVLQALVSPGTGGQELATALAQSYEPICGSGQDGQMLTGRMPSQHRLRLEHGMRAVLEDLVQAAAAASEPIMGYRHQVDAEPSVPRLLELALWLSEHKYCDPVSIFTLVEDVVETSTIDDCEVVFRWLEARLDTFKLQHLNSNGKFPLLRTCNQLLRRLSRSTNAELCGRILVYLAKFMALDERSGVNATGTINTSHSTPVDDVQEGDVDSNGQPIDGSFYRTFWGLQGKFQTPWDVMKADNWARTIADIKVVLAVFKAQPLTAAGSRLTGTGTGDAVAPKYLSSSKLIGLQLRDSALRRHFLLQCVILLHACQHVKAPVDTLKPKQVTELQEVEAMLYEEMQRTPDNGRDFTSAVRQLMQIETKWTQWKHDGAKAFMRERTELKMAPILPPRKRQRVVAANAVRVGTPELDRLWNLTPDNLNCLKADQRSHVPTLREFLGPVITEMDPEEGIEEQFKTKKDPVYNWKALRLLARTNLVAFQQTICSQAAEDDHQTVGAIGDQEPSQATMARTSIVLFTLASLLVASTAQPAEPLRLGHVADASYIPSLVAPSCGTAGLLPTPLPAVNTLVVVSSDLYQASKSCGQCVRFRASDPATQGGARPVPSTWSAGIITHENATYEKNDLGTGIPFTTAYPSAANPTSKSIEWQFINCPGASDPNLPYLTSPDPTPGSANPVTLSSTGQAAATPQPTAASTAQPTTQPTAQPTGQPTTTPYPTGAATPYPTGAATPYPTAAATQPPQDPATATPASTQPSQTPGPTPAYTQSPPSPTYTEPPQTPAPTQAAASSSSSSSSFAGDQSGKATYYGAGSDGGSWCKGNKGLTGYPGLPTVALNGVQFNGGQYCNACVLVKGTGDGLGGTPVSSAPQKYTINNICPECASGSLDLAANGDGIWGINWSFVDCGGKRKSRAMLEEEPEWFTGVMTFNKQGLPTLQEASVVSQQ